MSVRSRKRKNRKSKKSRKTHPSKVNVGFYTLAYLDILNQKEILRKIVKLPRNETEEIEFIKLLRKSFGVVDLFRSEFESVISGFDDGINKNFDKLTKEQQTIINRLTKTNLKRQCFSDTIIYYISLDESTDIIPINGIYTILAASSFVFIHTLSEGLVSRGAIETGIAGEFFLNEIYGSALYLAHNLESKVAKYPRIVIGDLIYDYLLVESEIKGTDSESNYRKFSAKHCLNFICKDYDGIKILDYLGLGIKNLKVDISELVDKALIFAKKEKLRFKSEGDSKLEERYHSLINYLSNRQKEYWS